METFVAASATFLIVVGIIGIANAIAEGLEQWKHRHDDL